MNVCCQYEPIISSIRPVEQCQSLPTFGSLQKYECECWQCGQNLAIITVLSNVYNLKTALYILLLQKLAKPFFLIQLYTLNPFSFFKLYVITPTFN